MTGRELLDWLLALAWWKILLLYIGWGWVSSFAQAAGRVFYLHLAARKQEKRRRIIMQQIRNAMLSPNEARKEAERA